MYEKAKSMTRSAEGKIPWMYLDTRGNVTVGIGHLLVSPEEAAKLPFILTAAAGATPPVKATSNEIKIGWTTIREQQRGMRAEVYQKFTAFHLSDEDMERTFDVDFQVAIDMLSSGIVALAGFTAYPEPAREALADMGFNMGVHRLRSKFPHLCAAAERHDWQTCAKECDREGIGDQRNAVTRQLFLDAV